MNAVTETLVIHSGGVRLHAQAAGPSGGPLVILLHGFPEYWGGWLHQIGPLAEAGLRVVAFDQRGYNLSDKPPSVSDYDIDLLAGDVLAVMDHFGRERASLVGHDWGAGVAWHAAGLHPARVEKLAVLNVPHGGAMTRALRRPLLAQWRKSWYIFAFQIPRLPELGLRAFGYRPLMRAIERSARPGTFSADERARYRQAWGQPGALTGGVNWYRALLRRALAGRPPAPRRVAAPTLILWGDRDDFLEPVLADWSLDWVDDGRVVHFPDATHWLAHEEPDAVNAHLIEFLR